MIRIAVILWVVGAVNVMACGTNGLPLVSPDKDAPLVEVVLKDMQLSQPFSVEITVCDEADIKALGVDAVMPAHQHGLNYTPTVVDLGDGAFRADGMVFHMPGVWEIRVAVTSGTGVTQHTRQITLQ